MKKKNFCDFLLDDISEDCEIISRKKETKSCFYNFGEEPEAIFIPSPNEPECKFVEKLMKDFGLK